MKIKSKIQFFWKSISNFLNNDKYLISKIYLFLDKFITRISIHNDFIIASGIAFNIFLYIIPLLLIGTYIAVNLTDQFNLDDSIQTLAMDFLPPTENTDILVYELLIEISTIQSGSITSGIIGLVSLLWLSSLFISTLRSGLDNVTELKSYRSVFFHKFKDVLLTLIIPIIFFLYAALLPLVTLLAHFLSSFVPIFNDKVIYQLIINSFSLLFTFLLFFFLYRFIPSRSVQNKVALTASVIGAIFITLARWLFAIYVSKFSNYGAIYGAYAIIISLAVWVYYLSFIILISLELAILTKNSYLNEAKTPQV